MDIVRSRPKRIEVVIPDAAQTSTRRLTSPAALAGVAMFPIASVTFRLFTGSAEAILLMTSCFNSSFWSNRPNTDTSATDRGASANRTRYAIPAARSEAPELK